MNTEWLKLRPFNGDVRFGFEELVCQLARNENIANRKKFIRVGTPDGGVEAYYILSNNEEYAWQAKYFTSIGPSQWLQIENSFKTALSTHPNLKKYFICLPLDRPDPRIVKKNKSKTKHAMDIWTEKTADWESYAKKLGRDIIFEYWGNSELFDRLSKPENAGKLYYWFGQEEFSDTWFRQKLDESIANLGKRYTPDLNFDLPIAKIFDGLSRDQYFQDQFVFNLDKLLKNYNKVIKFAIEGEKQLSELLESLKLKTNHFKDLYEKIEFTEIIKIDCEALIKGLNAIKEINDKVLIEIKVIESKPKTSNINKSNQSPQSNYSWEKEYCRKLRRSITSFEHFLNESTVKLSNYPALLLKGEAGIGKSHLLADIAEKRFKKNQFTILVLGQHLTTNEEPWTQINKILQITCDRDTFLSTLNSKAESNNSRILFFIDAINEGKGKEIWKNHIPGFISVIKRYPNLGVVFSLRTSYEKLLIPESVEDDKEIVKLSHYGFANFEYETTKIFFDNYKIFQPSIPLLHPEFSNPLFLKLFCEGLYKKNLHQIPDGYEGISTIINFYLDSVNEKISDKHNLPYAFQIVQKVVKHVAAKIAENNNSFLKSDFVFSFITGLNETSALKEKPQFYQDLISEGLLVTNIYRDKNENLFEGVYISYERFSDHLVCTYLMENYLNKDNPKESFKEGARLFEIIKDQNNSYFNKGIIDAFSIQIPELLNMEFYELIGDAKSFPAVVSSFIESIIWRKKEFTAIKNLDYINKIVIQENQMFDEFTLAILQITSTPGHSYNSDFIHKNLDKFTLTERDEFWSIFIHKQYTIYYDDINIVRRMIEWAWSDDNKQMLSDESLRLLCQTMIWFLTSSNRKLRDSTTKALINLLQDKLNVLIKLIKKFERVNDPYVIQRLYAVAYGCSVRTNNVKYLKELGECVYDSVFNTEYVCPDILLRDYARGVIEYAIFTGHRFKFRVSKIRPPYKSEIPKVFPTTDEIDKFEFNYQDKDYKDYFRGQNQIIDSMRTEKHTGYGDFGRYVFESAFRNWKNVDAVGLSNLAVKWIFEKYGYDVEKFGEFDKNIGSGRGRSNKYEERIGKKYQWIAFHELLAKVSDNYSFHKDSSWKGNKSDKFEGPWEPFVRDIDPTITIRKTSDEDSDKFWLDSVSYSNWDVTNKNWVDLTNDLPNPLDLINVIDTTGLEWLILEINPHWNEPTPIGEDDFNFPTKDLRYNLCSHLVSKAEFKKTVKYLSHKNLLGIGLSEPVSRSQMYSREYYWSPSYSTFNNRYYEGNDWETLQDRKSNKYISKIAKTTINYNWQNVFDYSKIDTINICKPTKLIFNLLKLNYSKIEGQLINDESELVCFDPSITNQTNTCLLINKLKLIKLLSENDLEIIWTIYGEKMIIGDGITGKRGDGIMDISSVIYFDSGELKYHSFFEKE